MTRNEAVKIIDHALQNQLGLPIGWDEAWNIIKEEIWRLDQLSDCDGEDE